MYSTFISLSYMDHMTLKDFGSNITLIQKAMLTIDSNCYSCENLRNFSEKKKVTPSRKALKSHVFITF